jgi:hypothetical protein
VKIFLTTEDTEDKEGRSRAVRVLPAIRTAKARAFLLGLRPSVTHFNVVWRSATAVKERVGELVNHERHERHQKESLLEGAETSGRKPERVTFFATTEDTETWAFVGRGLQTAAYKSGSLGLSPSTYFSSYLNSPVFFTVRGRAGMTRGTKVGWGYQPNFLRLKNAVFLGWWGA